MAYGRKPLSLQALGAFVYDFEDDFQDDIEDSGKNI